MAEFDVLRDGTIVDLVATSSVSAALDAATRAIQAVNPPATTCDSRFCTCLHAATQRLVAPGFS